MTLPTRAAPTVSPAPDVTAQQVRTAPAVVAGRRAPVPLLPTLHHHAPTLPPRRPPNPVAHPPRAVGRLPKIGGQAMILRPSPQAALRNPRKPRRGRRRVGRRIAEPHST